MRLRCQTAAWLARLDLACAVWFSLTLLGAAWIESFRFNGGEPVLERLDPAQQVFLFFTGLCRHRLHRFELLAADQIHAGQHPLELVAKTRLDLAAHSGQRADRAGGDPRHVVEESVLA